MSRLCKCGERILKKRFLAGIRTCHACGEEAAKVEIKAKQDRIAPAYNKGPLMYMGEGDAALKNFKHAGQKNATYAVEPTSSDMPPAARHVAATLNKVAKPQRKKIGVYYIGQECFTWWDGDDPETKGATRSCRLT